LRIGKPIFGVALALALGVAVHLTAQEPAQAPQNQQAPAPGAAPGRGGRGGRGGFVPRRMYEQQLRKLAPPAVIAQGKALFGVNCSSCHGSDLRGGEGGPNLLVSQVVLNDHQGELIIPIVRGARQAEGMPAFSLPDSEIRDIAAYIHSVAAGVGSQGRPPGETDTVQPSQILVGDPAAGKAYFDAHCTSCHSITGDLAGIGAKYPNPVTLQNTWVSGIAGGGGRGFFFGGGGGKPATVTVTLANGKTLEGDLVEANDFIVTLTEPNGTRVSLPRNGNVKSVVVHQPNEAHMKMVLALTDKDMHDVTCYLATIR
jgi:cytochrome c oxidase cbb3-type subunit 3